MPRDPKGWERAHVMALTCVSEVRSSAMAEFA